MTNALIVGTEGGVAQVWLASQNDREYLDVNQSALVSSRIDVPLLHCCCFHASCWKVETGKILAFEPKGNCVSDFLHYIVCSQEKLVEAN